MRFFLIALGLWGVANTCHSPFIKGEVFYFYQAFIALALYLEVSAEKLMYKYLSYLWMSYAFSVAFSEVVVFWLGVPGSLYYIGCFLSSASFFIYTILRSYKLPNDVYTGEGVYLKFKKPKNAFGISISLCFNTTCSVSVIVDDEWFGYKVGEPFHKQKYNHSPDDCLMKLDINKCYRLYYLKSMIGEPWGFHANCCHIVHNLILGHKFSPLDSIPCILLRKLKRLKKDGLI